LFERFPEGLVLVGEGRRVVSMNRRAQSLLGFESPPDDSGALTCCEVVCDAVVGAGDHGQRCLTDPMLRALDAAGGPRALLRGGGDALEVTVSRVDAEDVRVLLQITPAADEAPVASAEAELRVRTLGRFAVEGAGREVGGEWTEQRPGLLLKYLACERHRVAPSDGIAEALWPGAQRREALASLRHYVHVLRQRLEPDRGGRGSSSFVETHRGGYRLDPRRVWVDATEFELRAARGLELNGQGEPGLAKPLLESAVGLHRGEFLADEADEEWALEERERLHGMAARACGALVAAALGAGDLDSAGEHARRLADLEPLDIDVQRQLIEIWLEQGRRSDAARRFEVLRTRTLREFGEEPGFTLSDLGR
jgi:DNA-binding SARP family transcriptional activator